MEEVRMNYEALFSSDIGQDDYDEDAYKQRKAAERETAKASIEEMTEKVFTSPEDMQSYLRLQSKMGFSVNNTLLVMQRNPDATFVKHESFWQGPGRGIRRGEGKNAILLYKQDHEYEKADGTIGRGYNLLRYFDVSQTYGFRPSQRKSYPMNSLLKALADKIGVKIKLDAGLPTEVGAKYAEVDKTIYFSNNQPPAITFAKVAREIIRSETTGDFSEITTLIVTAAANVVGERFGIASLPLNIPHEDLKGLDNENKRYILEAIREPAMQTINRMYQSYELSKQEQQHDGR